MFGRDWGKAAATIVARDPKFTGDGSTVTYTYVADVRLPSGETFRATVHEPTIATDFWPPSIGDEVSVLVEPKQRKVKFDKDDERLSVKAYHAAKKKAFEDAQQQPAGSPPAGMPAQGNAAPAAFARLGAQAAATPEDRLATLQALHARGLLTSDEYATQRQRILDEI
jgi:hypothetical protein